MSSTIIEQFQKALGSLESSHAKTGSDTTPCVHATTFQDLGVEEAPPQVNPIKTPPPQRPIPVQNVPPQFHQPQVLAPPAHEQAVYPQAEVCTSIKSSKYRIGVCLVLFGLIAACGWCYLKRKQILAYFVSDTSLEAETEVPTRTTVAQLLAKKRLNTEAGGADENKIPTALLQYIKQNADKKENKTIGQEVPVDNTHQEKLRQQEDMHFRSQELSGYKPVETEKVYVDPEFVPI